MREIKVFCYVNEATFGMPLCRLRIMAGCQGRYTVCRVGTFRSTLGPCRRGCCCCSVAKWCQTLAIPPALQHKGLPCPSPPPGVCSNSCPSPVGDAIQPSLSSPSFPAFNLSEYQGLSQWVGSTVKNLPAYSGDIGSVPGLGRSPEGGNSN